MKAVQALPAFAAVVAAADFSLDSRKDIIESARVLAQGLMSLYNGNETGNVPGLLPEDEYYFWEGGVFMGAFVDYWHLTGDDRYNDLVQTGILHQVGEDENFMPANQSRALGNDDQCFWGLTAMTAAETGFQDPSDDEPQWLDLAKAVFESMKERIDHDSCDGGLRWQIFNFNIGWNYKNTISSACLINLGSRLARYTGEDKYTDTVDELWDWLVATGLIDSDTWKVYDGGEARDNCSDIDQTKWSYTASGLTYSAAVMFNYTDGSDTWRERVQKLSGSVLDEFFPDDIAVESFCETHELCDTDQIVFKGLSHRWLAATTHLAPFTAAEIQPILERSAQAAVDQCTGGKSGRKCGFYWSKGEYVEPDSSGVGEQMGVLAAVSNLLISGMDAPVTSSSSGSSSKDSEEEGGNGNDGDEETPNSTESGPAASSTPSNESMAGRVGFSVATFVLVGSGLMAWTC